jgi:hypothetical protein
MTDEQTKIRYDAHDETRDIDGQPRWRYVIGVDTRDPAPDDADKRRLIVHLTKPTEEQVLVLLRLVDLAEDDQMGTVRLYADALDALMAAGESHRCQRWLLQRRIDAMQFAEVGPAVLRHYWPDLLEKVEAPKNGPTARPRRRAAR